MGLTKNGDEGAYSALAGLPTFMAKLLTGGLTGGLMSRYCPEHKDANGEVIPPPPPQLWGSPEHCNGLLIWSIIGVTTASSALLLFFCRRKIRYVPVPDGGVLTVTGTPAENDLDLSDDVELTSPLMGKTEELLPPEPLRTKVVHASNLVVQEEFSERDPIPLDDRGL